VKINVEYPGLCDEKTGSGRRRWRVRVEGEKTKKITLPVSPKHPEFHRYYAAARQGQKLELATRKPVSAKSFDGMKALYTDWMEGRVKVGALSPSTLSSRRRGLQQAADCLAKKGTRIGEMDANLPLAAFAHIRDSFDERTGAAQTCLKALRAMYTWGAENGYPPNSDIFRVKSHHRSKGGAQPWSSEDKARFLSRHGSNTMARRWFMLAHDTAGRIGDMHLLGPQHEEIRDGQIIIRWQPRKRGSQMVAVPISKPLMLELRDLPEDAGAYLLTKYGKPFSSSGSLDNRVRKWIIEAGLCEWDSDNEKDRATRSQHGIRKARAEEIAEQGGSVFEVMALLSHSDSKTAGVYFKRFERERLVAKAVRRISVVGQATSVPPNRSRGTLAAQSDLFSGTSGSKWQPVGESNPSFQVENLAS
jgi:integrase